MLLDADGAALCRAGVVASPGDGSVDLAEIAEPDRLLNFYFGLGGRRVRLVRDEDAIEGRLETRWGVTGRHWWLDHHGNGGASALDQHQG